MQFDAIGTRWFIETIEEISPSVEQVIRERIEQFDKTYSRFRDDSLVALLEKNPGTYMFPEDSQELIAWYRKLYDATHGEVTPLIGSTLSKLGYDKHYSFMVNSKVPAIYWDEAMSWSGNVVTTTSSLSLDFGAAGKGYLVDIIGKVLESNGLDEYIIDASGDMQVRGKKTHIIGLEHPNDSSRIVGTVPLNGKSLCASATNRRKWGDGLHHVVNARTAEPVRDVVATWVIADSTMVADGLATSLFFYDEQQLKSLSEFQYVRIFSNGKVEQSEDFMGELFI